RQHFIYLFFALVLCLSRFDKCVLQSPHFDFNVHTEQGRTDNSWGPQAIGDHGALCPCPNSRKPMKKAPGGYQGHLMGPPTDP
ncbi:unnamed protein product, partial [Staurois parvus]